jgi:putative effector of murein hydrolase LrgA (UPF0299 family)
MASSRKPIYPNPFYVLLVIASTALLITVLGWLIAPMIQQKALNTPPGSTPPGPASIAMAAWFDRWSVTALTVELVIIFAASFLAMASDRWFQPKVPADEQ